MIRVPLPKTIDAILVQRIGILRSAGLLFEQASIQKCEFRSVDLDRPLLCKPIEDAADDLARGADTGCKAWAMPLGIFAASMSIIGGYPMGINNVFEVQRFSMFLPAPIISTGLLIYLLLPSTQRMLEAWNVEGR